MNWKRILTLLLLAGGLYWARRSGFIDATGATADRAGGPTATSTTGDDGAELIAAAFSAERSGFMVETAGVVDRVLPDDDEGDRHQRFVLRLDNRHSVLVAHNLELAKRVPIEEGDPVAIKGQYEWNERGGVLHWTHHDPRGSHEAGWIRFGGTVYE